jgi:tetratricopeptide (TPR) repeat protein
MTTLYDMLDVRPDDDAGTVKEAFRKAVKVCHPDLNADDPKAPARFMEIVRANAILSDPELRAVYDRMLEFERHQHQLASSTYKIVPDAIVVVVLAVVMAGAYTLYTNFPEVSVYLPKIFTANIKAGADAAREAADTATVQPSPPPEARIADGARGQAASAAVAALGAVAATEKGAVAAEDVAREPGNAAAQPSLPADPNPAGGARDQVGGAATSVTAAVAPTEKDAALTGNAAHASGTPAAMQALPPSDANNAGGGSAQPPAPAPSVVTPPLANAVETAPSHEPSPSAPVKDAQFYRQQGIASYRSGDLPVAMADFDLAIRLDPSLEEAYIDRGIVLYRLHQLDRAFADVAQAMRIARAHQDALPLPRAPRRLNNKFD